MTDAQKIARFVPDILTVSQETGEKPELLGALILRESGGTWAIGYEPKGDPKGFGDRGNGHGICQIDKRYHKDWLRTHDWWEPIVSLRYACGPALLGGFRQYLKILPTVPAGPMFERLVYASYNCGPHKARLGWLQHGDPDHYTTPSKASYPRGDYSRWIFDKAEELRIVVPEFTPRVA